MAASEKLTKPKEKELTKPKSQMRHIMFGATCLSGMSADIHY